MSPQLELAIGGRPRRLSRKDLDLLAGLSPWERALEGCRRAASKWSDQERVLLWRALKTVCAAGAEFTTDDIYAALPETFPVTKGIAVALLLPAQRFGLIEPLDRFRASQRGGEHDHAQRLRVWRPTAAAQEAAGG